MSIVTEEPHSACPAVHDRPLRVLLITQAAGGGVGRHFFDLAEGLRASGVDTVGIYSPRKVDTTGRARLASNALPPMHAFPMRRAIHPLDVPDFWRLMKLIRQLGPFDLIHGHSSKGGALANLAARRLRIPAIYTPNSFVTADPSLPAWRRRIYAQLERSFSRTTAAIVAVSHDEVDHACSLGIDRAKLHVIPNGIDRPNFPSREEVRARLGIKPHEFVVGFIGRFTSQKAPEVMLQAFAAAFRQAPNVRLVMVGAGPLDAMVRQELERLGLGSRVMLLGDVIGTDYMPAFDLYCLSSRYEGMPYVLIEALTCGLPIVSTRSGGVTMCVDEEKNGLIVPIDDVPALAAALERVVGDPELRRRFADESASRATQFTAQQLVASTLDLYHRVLGVSARAT